MEVMTPRKEGGLILRGIDFHTVPEGCFTDIVALTTPADACRLALVSRDFMSASESDVVWERFLPSDSELIVARSDGGEALLADVRSKKQLYMDLADRPRLVDGSSKSFWLHKSSGDKCWMIPARSLSIAWDDTPRYWRWTSVPESRFPEVAELVSVCWLEISVKIKSAMLSRGVRYVVYLVFKMTAEAYGQNNVCEASVSSDGCKIDTQLVCLITDEEQSRVHRTPSMAFRSFSRLTPPSTVNRQAIQVVQFPKTRPDGWNEVKIGEFITLFGEEDEVELSVHETKELNWKTGLIVEGFEVRPA